jgi:hypothetical protein
VCYHDARSFQYYTEGIDGACDNAKEHLAYYYCNDCGTTFYEVESHSYSEYGDHKCDCGAKDPHYYCDNCGNLYSDCFCN